MSVRQDPSISQMKSAACAGKTRFDDASSARTVLERMNDRKHRCGVSHVYHCRYCAGWHIGHMKPRQQTRRRRADQADESCE